MSTPGKIVWQDLTVPNAEIVSEFYSKVAGWEREALSEHGGDFNMINPDTKEIVAGICYAKGSNANVPPFWLMYISVDDVAARALICEQSGGKIIDGPRMMGGFNFCAIQDPAGAYIALIDEKKNL